jgi:hypothetical protein
VEIPEIPKEFSLDQNYPNPFNPVTAIRFGLPVSALVSLRIYNVLGQQVAELGGDVLGAGYHELVWDGKAGDGTAAGSGVYLCRLVAGSPPFVAVRKMMLLK